MVSNRRCRCMLICLGLVMEIRIVVVVTAVLDCLLRPSERKFSKNERFFLGAFGRGTGLVAENSESTQRLALHVPLLCSFRFLPAHVCRMQLPILEPRDCFSRQAEGLKCRQNSGTLGVMSWRGAKRPRRAKIILCVSNFIDLKVLGIHTHVHVGDYRLCTCILGPCS